MKDYEFIGPELERNEFFLSLAPRLQAELEKCNGYVAFEGGFHLRGVCAEPLWHSIEELLGDEGALHELFDELEEGDIPFAQDCMGDQFVLRGDKILRLYAEAGEIEDLKMSLDEFFDILRENHSALIDLDVLEPVKESGDALKPGEVLIANPPFVMEESEESVTLEAMPCLEALEYYAELAQHIRSLAQHDIVEDDA